MEKGDYFDELLRSPRTVFSFKEIALLWNDSGTKAARVRVDYYIKTGKLIRLRQGLYAKDKEYNHLELATKIFTPSYITFETVLLQAGITFQYYGKEFFLASYLTREVKIDGMTYTFKKIKDSVLTSSLGIKHENFYSIATPERAFLDTIYRSKSYHFDNMGALNWDMVFTILPIYQNDAMKTTVTEYHDHYKSTL